MSMRKESGEITPGREENLEMCVDFYKSLFTQTIPTPESAMKSSSDTGEIPEFIEEEVEADIKKDEKTQSPRNTRNYKWYYKTGGINRSHLPKKNRQ